MHKNKRILALIPARGGSKGLPGKNILPFDGKPLLAWSIEQARKSAFIDTVIVSTDAADIAAVAGKYGAEVPFLRPKNISGSLARSVDVVFHAADFLEQQGRAHDFIVLLQPTSPLRIWQDIDSAIALSFNNKSRPVISVCKTEHSPLWSARLPKNLSMKGFINPAMANKPRQSLPDFYRINGAIYFAATDFIRNNRGFLGSTTMAYVMPPDRSVDIDTAMDFEFAAFIKAHQKK